MKIRIQRDEQLIQFMVQVPLVSQEFPNTHNHLQHTTRQREGIFYALNDWFGALTKKQFPIEVLCERIR